MAARTRWEQQRWLEAEYEAEYEKMLKGIRSHSALKMERLRNDPGRTVVGGTLFGVKAAFAPHPITAFHQGLSVERLGRRILKSLGWKKRRSAGTRTGGRVIAGNSPSR